MFDLIRNDKTFTVFDIGFGKVVCLSFKINNNKPKIIGMDYQKVKVSKNLTYMIQKNLEFS